MNAFDTNIWLYRHDRRDPDKKEKAKRLIDKARPLVLLWQVGCEFIAASRKLEPQGFGQTEAWDALADMQTIAAGIILPEPQIWPEARALQARHSLSFWDALIIAASIRGGVTALYTEDIGAPRMLNGLSLINPF